MKEMRNILWGLVLIGIGVIFGLNALEITNINIFFDGWWTLFIIVPCFINLFNEDSKTGDLVGLAIGCVLLLCCQDVLNFGVVWKLMIPAILVIIGLSIIFKDAFGNKVKKEVNKINEKKKADSKTYTATFSGTTADYTNETFEGCELSSVFGAVTCDVRKAKIKGDTVITVSAIFGGVDIYVPDDVNVKICSNSIFGGVSNSKKQKDATNHDKTIYINATCIFGGVEIK